MLVSLLTSVSKWLALVPLRTVNLLVEKDLKGTQLLTKIRRSFNSLGRFRILLAKELNLKREKLINPLGQVIPCTLILLITLYIGIVVL